MLVLQYGKPLLAVYQRHHHHHFGNIDMKPSSVQQPTHSRRRNQLLVRTRQNAKIKEIIKMPNRPFKTKIKDNTFFYFMDSKPQHADIIANRKIARTQKHTRTVLYTTVCCCTRSYCISLIKSTKGTCRDRTIAEFVQAFILSIFTSSSCCAACPNIALILQYHCRYCRALYSHYCYLLLLPSFLVVAATTQ